MLDSEISEQMPLEKNDTNRLAWYKVSITPLKLEKMQYPQSTIK